MFVQRYVVPPQVRVWQMSWLAALHVYDPPPEQIPSPPAPPQPTQNCPMSSWFAVQLSGQTPSSVRQPPDAASHVATQHWFAGPTPQGASAAVHEHASQASSVPLQYRVQLPG